MIDSGLRNGNYDYTVRIVDAAGNIGRESGVYDLRVSLPRGSSSGDDGDLLQAGDPAPAPIGIEELASGGEPVSMASGTSSPQASLDLIALPPPTTLDPLLSA